MRPAAIVGPMRAMYYVRIRAYHMPSMLAPRRPGPYAHASHALARACPRPQLPRHRHAVAYRRAKCAFYAAGMQLKIALEKVLSETAAGGKHNDVREAAQAALERLKAVQVGRRSGGKRAINKQTRARMPCGGKA